MRTYEVDVTWSNGEREFSRKAARELLGIKTRKSFNEHLKALKLFGKSRLKTSDLVEVLKLQLFLNARPGVHSRAQYVTKLRLPKVLEAEMKVLHGIDVNQHVVRLFGGAA